MMLPEVVERILDLVDDKQKAEAVIELICRAESEEKKQRSQRQLSGIEAARQRGVKFGRPIMDFPVEFPQIYEKQQQGSITVSEASRILNISRQQFYRLRKRFIDDAEK